MASENIIELNNINFAYGERKILNDISLHVQQGEVVGLLGPNGSGKSTLLKIIANILKKKTGELTIMNCPVSDFSGKELAKTIAFVPQESIFSFPFSVIETVIMGRYPHADNYAFESTNDIEIARQALKRCDALKLATRKIQELSSGERQRVVFARALAQKAPLLLLDEPASFLDIKHQVELYDIARDLAKKENCAVLTVLHDLNLASEYCDRIYLLANGDIKANGATQEVLSYENLKTVFDTDVYIDKNDLTGKILITPLSKEACLNSRHNAS